MKREENANLESLREYVLIDQKKCTVETFFREEPNLWRNQIFDEKDSSVYLKSLDCSIEMAKIYKRIVFPTPKRKP